MKIDDILLKNKLPKRYFDTSFDLIDKFKQEMNSFKNDLELVDGAEFKKEQQEQIQHCMVGVKAEVERNAASIVNILDAYQNADWKSAQTSFDHLMKHLENDLFIVSMYDAMQVDYEDGSSTIRIRFNMEKEYPYYRIRSVNGRDEKIETNRNELFHLPWTKRARSSNMRFSVAGFPALYLSSELPLAWQESGYPKKYYYSKFKYKHPLETEAEQEDIKLIALYSPSEVYSWGFTTKYNYFGLWLTILARYLKQFPLILACAFVNHGGNVVFKQEYIISQMLMQWIQRNPDIAKGVSYFSCHDLTLYDRKWHAYNVAIPMLLPRDGKGYSEPLGKRFDWENPTYYEIPLTDQTKTTEDREKLNVLHDKIRDITRNVKLPKEKYFYLEQIDRICVALYSLLDNGESADMEMLIHMFNLIEEFNRKIEGIENENQEKLREDLEKEPPGIDVSESMKTLKEIDRIFENEVRDIIKDHKQQIWNFIPQQSNDN